ncbi:hypothetical protein [Streptomyces sp. NPDC051079]|uniref:hypothetical protein n=1 Tax=Streptomyces sp. NPDC051079 TaxID=3155043 RepID=UPI003450618A
MTDQTADQLTARIYDSLVAFNGVACWDVLRLAQMRAYLAEHLAQDPAVRDAARQAAGQPADPTTADDPVALRWGLNDVLWGDDDTITVCLSGPDREPYWLELTPDQAAVLRDDLAGPDVPAVGQQDATQPTTDETEARAKLYAHLDPIPVPAAIRDALLNDYRAAILNSAADRVETEATHIRYGSATDYASQHAVLLRRLAAGAES